MPTDSMACHSLLIIFLFTQLTDLLSLVFTLLVSYFYFFIIIFANKLITGMSCSCLIFEQASDLDDNSHVGLEQFKEL